ncbi:MAG: hypothetical protein LBT74_09645 [Acidobacteriota bacterium]|jgi:hypothetical protein|nr:hypothetical protein [Acidobacteriota bacterium]
MLNSSIQQRLSERFSAPLPEFHKRRIVFWHNEFGEFGEAVDEPALDGVTLVKRTGKSNFAVKKLLSADDLTNGYLVYALPTYDKESKDDRLLDMRLYGEEFRTGPVS